MKKGTSHTYTSTFQCTALIGLCHYQQLFRESSSKQHRDHTIAFKFELINCNNKHKEDS